MSDEYHAFHNPPPASPYVNRKIDMMGTALGRVEAGATELATCLPSIQDNLVRAQIGQVAENVRLRAASLRERFVSSAGAGGEAASAVAFALDLENLRAGASQLTEQVDAAKEIPGVVRDGLVNGLLDQIRQATDAFWHLLVLLLRQWALKGLIDVNFED